MEWVRACFRSKWRIFRDSDRLQEGFFWFCPPTTPFYPGVHNLSSRDWTSDERDPPPLLGEYEGERSWYRGEPPARRPLPILVGDPTCISHGESPGTPATLNVSAECSKVLPDACYGLEEEIFSKTNVWDCVFGHLTARVIDAAYTDLADAATIVAAYMPPGTVVSTFAQPDELIPAGVIATISDTVVLWLTGTTNFQQLAGQGLYFGLGPVDQGAYSASVLDENAAMAILDILNARGLGGAERIVLAGHSYGGAVCMVMAARMITANPNRNVEILTLGAPAPGDDRLQTLIELLAQRHYATERDPIPYLPPGSFAFPWLLPVVGLLLISQWAKFARTPKIRQITQDGRFIDARTSDLPDDFLSVSALAIAAGFDLPNFKDHRADWYAYYLCLACKCVPRPCPPPGGELVGFDFILEGLRWTDGVDEHVENFAANLVYQASPDNWVFIEGAHSRATIVPVRDGFGNFESFDVFYEIETPGPLTSPFVWHFAADEMLVGVDTTSQPALFFPNPGQAVLGMGRLVIPAAFLFPPIDGDGPEGDWDPILDGDGP